MNRHFVCELTVKFFMVLYTQAVICIKTLNTVLIML